MRCPQCSAENPDQAKFCLNCGHKLTLTCAQCGTELPGGARFCFNCGAKIGAAPPVTPPTTTVDAISAALKRLVPQEFADRLLAMKGKVEGERRMVTILFSDVKGSTAMAEHLDPEDVMEIMNGAFEYLIEPIYRHEGTLGRLMGDAILAFFGAPISHENDPERACRAALDIIAGIQKYAAKLERERGIKGFNVRVGINTGLVVMGEVGSDLRVEYTAMGDTINLASRLEQNAPAGGILISHETYQHVRGIFDLERLEPITVKGKAEPVQVYLVLRAKPRAFRPKTRGLEGITTRMVGRDAELKQLQDAFYTAIEDSERQIVTVTGEAGMGKSRLLYEFENWLETLSETVSIFRGRASQEMQSVPYALIRDVFAFRFQIQESDPPRVVWEKMEQGISGNRRQGTVERAGFVVTPQDWPSEGVMRAHFIGQLLGFDFSTSPYLRSVKDDARQLRDRALIYLTDFFQTTSASEPTAIFLEDIHWADDSSLDLIHHLAVSTANHRLLIICLSRPTLYERRPHWGEGQPFHRRLELQPLSKRDSRLLIEEILQKVEEVPASLRDLVISNAEGNPYYVEELLKMLIEDGIIVKGPEMWRVETERLATMRVPSSLTAILQARLDCLPPVERTVLQQGAVIGRVFWDSAVARLNAERDTGGPEPPENLSATLDQLRSKEMIFRHETSAFAGVGEYTFKHAILREVAYENVLKKIRRRYHALVAEWLQEQSGERVGEYTGLIAEHLELAGETDRAIHFLKQAGEQAARRYANAAAINYFCRALALTPETDAAGRYDLLLARERAYDIVGARETQSQDLAALETLAEALDDDRRRAEVALRRASFAEATGQYPAAIASAQRAIEFSQKIHDVNGKAAGYLHWGRALWRQGDHAAARPYLEQSLALAQAIHARQLEADCLRSLGSLLTNMGNHTAAREYHEQALRLSQELGDRRGEGATLNNLGRVASEQGDHAGARAYYERALRRFREIGDRRGEGIASVNLGRAASEQGDYVSSRAYYEQTLRLFREIGDRRGESLVSNNLSVLCHQLGDNTSAREYSQQSLQIAQELGQRVMQGDALSSLGRALLGLAQGDQTKCRDEATPSLLAQAADTYQQALTLWREMEDEQELVMEALAGLAGVSLARGDLAQARSQIEEILHYLENTPPKATEESLFIRLVCYQVLQASQDPRASVLLETANRLLQERAAQIKDNNLRRSFLEEVPEHRMILDAAAHSGIP